MIKKARTTVLNPALIVFDFNIISRISPQKELYCVYKIVFKIRANLKRHNRVYILSSKHTYRPMRARVIAQLFYK